MRRVPFMLAGWLVALALTGPAAVAHDAGQGWWGEADDKVVTNAGFILIIFFPLFVLAMSMLQWSLDKRKERRKKARKALARDTQALRGGW